MKQILPGLLIFLIIIPIVCAEICDLKLEIGEEVTCGNYKIRHDSWDAGDQNPHQIAHFHLPIAILYLLARKITTEGAEERGALNRLFSLCG
ncbi:MAG: hypothetical protein C4B59_15425 [Candidatus Methanogaster sp.]|uniref:Uncharacterized protein n=1 Tax=Candidatus Methanogaster sp. TaxID=3386292 RepID=A0AC61KZ05_9EURY|nr:MAG: hypothetical protein C4B59_15425 [ANME-2 cluster archaeon]